MATFSYSKVEDLANFPPPDGSYKVGIPGTDDEVEVVEISGGFARDPSGKETPIPLSELKNKFAAKFAELAAAGQQAPTIVFDRIDSGSNMLLIGGAVVAGYALWYFTRKKGAA